MQLSAKQLGKLADKYYTARQTRRDKSKEVDALKEVETKLWHELKDALIDSKVNGISGALAHVELVNKQKPVIVDAEKFHKYIIKNDAWDLVQKSVVASAAQARWEDKVKIPGVESEAYVDLSIGKV